ncbi:unannotated protein [freshwater metagenome]|uniref:Unannotated protein n=1 Tax=freshwater metagenome TaxID=449393 RepID=A0A6J7QLQ6_9ZZZZ
MGSRPAHSSVTAESRYLVGSSDVVWAPMR